MLFLQYLIFLLQPPKPAPVGVPAPASRGRLCCRTGRTAPPYSIAGQAIPLVTHTFCYFPAAAAEPVNPRSPLCMGFHCRVVPFLGLAVVHRRGALSAAWSMWSTADFHRKSIVRGEADSWVHGCSWVHGHSPVFWDMPSKSLCQACWAANLSRRGELHLVGQENGLSVMGNGLYIFKTHQTRN